MTEQHHVDPTTITPVRVGDLPAFLAAIEPVTRELAEGDLMAALTRNAEQVIQATAIGAGVDREWLNAQSLDVLLELATAVIEVNADFFVQRLLPAIEAAVTRLNTALAETGGANGSSNSPAPDSAIGT